MGSVSSRWRTASFVIVVGVALTVAVAVARSMPDRDTLELIGIATGVAFVGVMMGVPSCGSCGAAAWGSRWPRSRW